MNVLPIKPEVRRVASKVREILEGAEKLNSAALRFIDSTFSNPSVRQLELILKNDESGDGDSLLEFLVQPDECFQLELERTLAANPLEEDEEEQVARLLDSPPAAVTLSFPGGRGMLRVDLTPPLVRRLLFHLKLAWRPFPGLADALDAAGNSPQGDRLRMRLRHSGVDWSESKAEFMGRLLQIALSGENHDLRWIDFALECLSDIPAGADPGLAFEHRKRLLVRALHRSRRQSDLIQSANIETLVSRGIRLAHLDEPAARLQVAHIDRISLAVYGLIWPVPEADEVALEARNDRDLTSSFQ